METMFAFVGMNLVYAIMYLLIMKFRTTKSKDWRLLDQDYEVMETSDQETQDVYWEKVTKQLKHFLIFLWFVMNVSLFMSVVKKDIGLALAVVGIGLCIALVSSVYKNVKLKKQLHK